MFAKEQPDLNWENEETRNAIYDSAMRFWLDKGVDGFRIDCVNMYSKGIEYQDAPIANPAVYEQPAWMIYANGPRMNEFLREMNTKVLDKYDSMTVGELPHTPDPNHVLKYVGLADRQLNMVFQFDIVDIGQGSSYKYQFQEWKLPTLKNVISKWQRFIEGTDGWTTSFCENHDQGRSVSRYASDAPQYRVLSAKMLSMMLCAMTGTLFVYQGQEIGMINIPEDWSIDELKDIEALNYYRDMEASPDVSPETMDYIKRSIRILGRDNARIPMQWDASAFAGFTDAKEGGWMRVHDLYPEINVAKQQREPGSALSFWKSMIKFRKAHPETLTYGAFEVFEPENEQTFVFTKKQNGGTKIAVVALNFTGEEQPVRLPYDGLSVAVGNYDDVVAVEKNESGKEKKFRPWEGRLYLGEA